jgi:hypothetical protein
MGKSGVISEIKKDKDAYKSAMNEKLAVTATGQASQSLSAQRGKRERRRMASHLIAHFVSPTLGCNAAVNGNVLPAK